MLRYLTLPLLLLTSVRPACAQSIWSEPPVRPQKVTAILATRDGRLLAATNSQLLVSANSHGGFVKLSDSIKYPNLLCEVGPYIFASNGLSAYRSEDRGATWRNLNLNIGLIRIARSPNGNLYGISYTPFTHQLLRSTDDGLSWNTLTNPPGAVHLASISFDSAGTMWLACDGEGLYSSADEAATWSLHSTDFTTPYSEHAGRVEVGPSGDILVATSGGVYRAPSSTGHFTLVLNHWCPQMFVDDIGGIHATFGYFLFSSYDGGATWDSLGIAEEGLVSYSWRNGVIYAGGPNVWELSGKAKYWTQLSMGLPIMNGATPFLYARESGRLFLGARAGDSSGIGIFRSSDFGESWRRADSGLDRHTKFFCFDRTGHAYSINPKGLWRSDDECVTWKQVLDSTAWSKVFFDNVLPYLYCDADGAIYTLSGKQKSTDLGATWTYSPLNPPLYGTCDQPPSLIASVNDRITLMAGGTDLGYSLHDGMWSVATDNDGFVYQEIDNANDPESSHFVTWSSDKGQHWSRSHDTISYPTGMPPANILRRVHGVSRFVTDDRGYVYAGGPWIGVFRSTDHAQHWESLMDLRTPGYQQNEIALSPDGTLYWYREDFKSGGGPQPVLILHAQLNHSSVSESVHRANALQLRLMPSVVDRSTTLEVESQQAGSISIQIVNQCGQIVRELTSHARTEGTQRISLDRAGLAAGLYLVRVSTAGITSSVKMIVR